ncbi:hypothetical protein [Chryseobacterium sp. CFS15]|uniref:hypothetical protein n=1 Tax=Chryseobacterium sp. CFS15 TaxID=2986946 RepID=UPI002806C22B|nr:hypothetical protein [Chryseobacterium sp. CFS15]MDQ8141067.1 hypothetical protein [Chryseobacterium sp. CFS15]
MTSILYTSKNEKNYIFLYSFQQEYLEAHDGNVLIFEIWEEGKEELDMFSFMLREMENGTDLKVVDLFPDSKKYYLGKGISRAMILHCKNLFVKRIISERRDKNWEEARTKVWERMKFNGEVAYCEFKDFYFTI